MGSLPDEPEAHDFTDEDHRAGGAPMPFSVPPGAAAPEGVEVAGLPAVAEAPVLPPVPALAPSDPVVDAAAEPAAEAAVAPVPPAPAVAAPPAPKPKPPIRPERCEQGFRTDGILLEPGGPRAWFVTVSPPARAPQRIYVHASAFDHLIALATATNWEPGKLWTALCDIPLERPLPSRRLEEELRALITTFAVELRGARPTPSYT